MDITEKRPTLYFLPLTNMYHINLRPVGQVELGVVVWQTENIVCLGLVAGQAGASVAGEAGHGRAPSREEEEKEGQQEPRRAGAEPETNRKPFFSVRRPRGGRGK